MENVLDGLTLETLSKAFTHLFDKVENIERLLQIRTDPKPEADDLLTIQQAAGFLKLSVPTLYGLVSRAAIPVNKKSRRLYFSKQKLAVWVKKSRRKTKRKVQAAGKADIRRKVKRINLDGRTKCTQAIKNKPEKKSQSIPVIYERGKTKITGNGTDVKCLIWTDSIIHWLWILFAFLLALVHS